MDYYSVGYHTPLAMPMFNLHSLQLCKLCEVSPSVTASLCVDCWRSLPWLKKEVLRQELPIWAACAYDYPLDRIIQQFKYQQQLQYQTLLVGILSTVKYTGIQAIVPMPISLAKLAERGFNQSVLLAQGLSHKLKLPIWQPILRHAEHSQKGLTRQERLLNIEHQFYPDPNNKTRFKRVLIVDDVVTTGSSIRALSNQLQLLHCQQIRAACLAVAET
jgi:ComF family protein